MALAELTVAVGIMALVASMAAVTYGRVLRLRKAQDGWIERVGGACRVLEYVARDVRAAEAFLAESGGFVSDETTLILKLAGKPRVYGIVDGRAVVHEPAAQGWRGVPVTTTQDLRVRFRLEGGAPPRAQGVVVTVTWDEHPDTGIGRPTLSRRIVLRRPAP